MAHDPVDPNSTFTQTFGFEKAMLGAYTGRWQLLINDNLDLIDAAIAGKAAANHAHAGTYEPAITTLAVAKGMTAEEVTRTVHAHPTLCECFRDACARAAEAKA